MRKDRTIKYTKKNYKLNETVEWWKAQSAILETYFEQGLAKQENLTPVTATSAAGLVDRFLCRQPPQWPQLRKEGQWATTVPHRYILHTSSHLTIRHQDTALCLCSDFRGGRGPEGHPVPPHCSPPLCLCHGVVWPVPQLPRPTFVTCFQVISKGAQRIIPRILDIGQGSPIIGSASRVCATCISCTAF